MPRKYVPKTEEQLAITQTRSLCKWKMGDNEVELVKTIYRQGEGFLCGFKVDGELRIRFECPYESEMLDHIAETLIKRSGSLIMKLSNDTCVDEVTSGREPHKAPRGTSQIIWNGGDRHLKRVDYANGSYVLKWDIYGLDDMGDEYIAFSDVVISEGLTEYLEYLVRLQQHGKALLEKKALECLPDLKV